MSKVFGTIFTITIAIGVPVFFFIYAIFTKRLIPFILGVLTFIISQVILRLPLINYLNENSIHFTMLSMTRPVLFSILLAFSAGIFEEVARFIMMRLFMKERSWKAGFLFGAGHGGIEAILFVGIPVLMFTPTSPLINGQFFVGGIERLFAIILHIGLSIIVLNSVVQKKYRYLFVAIIIHGLVNSSIGIVPLLFQQQLQIIIVESILIIVSMSVLIYAIYLKRKDVLT